MSQKVEALKLKLERGNQDKENEDELEILQHYTDKIYPVEDEFLNTIQLLERIIDHTKIVDPVDEPATDFEDMQIEVSKLRRLILAKKGTSPKDRISSDLSEKNLKILADLV